MKEQFTDYDTAKMLKELGFDERCMAFHHEGTMYSFGDDKDNEFVLTHKHSTCNSKKTICLPLWQQIEEWLWEKHKEWIAMDGDTIQGRTFFSSSVCSESIGRNFSGKSIHSEHTPITAKTEGIKAAVKHKHEQFKTQTP